MVDSIENQICETIEFIVAESIKKARFDRTIQAIIVSCEDPLIGKYRCNYQDTTIYAYSVSSSYSKGDMVYIHIPENDMKKNKTILGLVDQDSFFLNTIDGKAKLIQPFNAIGNFDDEYFSGIIFGEIETDGETIKGMVGYSNGKEIFRFSDNNISLPSTIITEEMIDSIGKSAYLVNSDSLLNLINDISSALGGTATMRYDDESNQYYFTFNNVSGGNDSTQEIVPISSAEILELMKSV